MQGYSKTQKAKPDEYGRMEAAIETGNAGLEPDRCKFFAVVSQKAGRYNEDVRKEISSIFSKEGLTVDFYPLGENERLTEEIAQAHNKGYCSFLAIGGDGTVDLLASGLYGKPHRLGIIPVGTTNTLARVLGIPLTPREAIEVAATSTNTRQVDGLNVRDKMSIMNVSVGISSISLDSIDSEQKSRFGVLAYLIGILRSRKRIKERSYELQIDGKLYNIKAVELHVTNIGVIGTPLFRIYQDSSIDDGKAEVLTLRRWSVNELFNAILDILTRRKRQAIRLVGKGEEIVIRSNTPVTAQADGDIIQNTPVRIKVLHRAINFIVP